MEDHDRHIRRGRDEYTHALQRLYPRGTAWPRNPETTFMKLVRGLAGIWAFVDGRIADLLERETDPRITLEMLPDWERNWGLPDKCVAEPLTIGDRQIALIQKMTMKGGQSRAFFIALAERLGYTILIREYSPWMFGVSQFGLTEDDTGYWRWEIGPPEMRFYWTVFVNGRRLTWWQFGLAIFGVDPHLRISLATDLFCIFHRYKPAHTDIVFDYSGLFGGPGDDVDIAEDTTPIAESVADNETDLPIAESSSAADAVDAVISVEAAMTESSVATDETEEAFFVTLVGGGYWELMDGSRLKRL